MTAEEIYDEYRANWQEMGFIVKCWNDVSPSERAVFIGLSVVVNDKIRQAKESTPY